MNYLLIAFGVMVVVVVVALALVRFLPKPTRPTTAQATTPATNNAPTTTRSRTISFSWDGIRSTLFPIFALIAILFCGYLISPDFTTKVVGNKKFWAFLILGATAYLFLSVHAPFKENKLRKLILFVFFVGGLVLLLDILGINIPKNIFNSSTSKSSSTVLDGGKAKTPITAEVTPEWTNITIPAGPFEWESTGWIEFKFSNGKIIKVPNGTKINLPKIPGLIGQPKTFQVRGEPGEVTFQMK
jgi:hypothetical protein